MPGDTTAPTPPTCTRRHFLGGLAAAAATPAAASQAAQPAAGEIVSFFVIGDTHFLADSASPSRLDERSAAVTGRLVDRLNGLVGTEIPAAATAGVVRPPCGVLHAGDIIDTGDKTGVLQSEMQRTETAAFERLLGLTGRDGSLDFPIYEVHGNHDGPAGKGVAIDRIIDRNKTRPGVRHVSANGLHYSWDVGDVHFVNLGIVVGTVPGIHRRRRYAPLDSLDFLVKDLATQVGRSGRPVFITHHVDIARYTKPVADDAPFASQEWDPADVGGFHRALAGYTIAGIFYGHTHARAIWRWDGSRCHPAAERLPAERAEAPSGPAFDVFNVDNASHFAGGQQAIFYAEHGPAGLTLREYTTTDAWQTGRWSPIAWHRLPQRT
jgi:hypothetical protein